MLIAVSNSQPVQLALWPLPHVIVMPVYLLVVALLLLGVLAGLGMGWWAGRHHRRRAREASDEAARLEREVQRLRQAAPAAPPSCASRRPRAARPEGDRAPERAGRARAVVVRPAQPVVVRILSAAEVDASLDDLALIDRLDALFRAGCEMPLRHHHTIAAPAGPGSADATLLLMPAWTRGAQSHLGIKMVTVFPDNGKRSLPSIYGQYLLLDGTTGAAVALLDGTMLTKRRTACASGLASRYLSRPDVARGC